MNELILSKVDYFSQRDNKIKPYVSCYPTSVAMAINYCLTLKKLDRTAIGCDIDTQIEDYINELFEDSETKAWIKENKKWLGFSDNSTAREFLFIENYMFNRLMNPIGYRSEGRLNVSFLEYCEIMEQTKLPIVLAGNFKSVSRIRGHVVCGVGFNKVGLKEVIVHDPFGSALKGYPKNQSLEQNNKDGSFVHYGTRFFVRNAKEHMYTIIVYGV